METLDVQVSQPNELSQLRRFRAYAIAAVVWAFVMVLLPTPLQSPWYVLLVLATVIVAVPQIRALPKEIQRPIVLVAIAAATSLTAAVVRSVSASSSGTDNPFPSPAEPFVFLSYIFFISAILYIVRRRNPKIGLDPILDAAVGTIAVALLVVSLVLIPYIEMSTTSAPAAWLNVAYTCLALLQVAVAILALVTGSESTTSNRFLAAGLVATFALDVTALLVISGRAPVSVQNMVLGIPPILGALGILHPSVRQLTARPSGDDVWRRLSRRRVSVLALALLTPPALMLVTVLQDGEGRRWSILPAAASLALTPLVVVRLGRLVRQNEELASLEAALRVIGEKLVSAENSEQVEQIVADGAREVLGRHAVSATVVLGNGSQSGWELGDETLQSALDSMRQRTHSHDHPRVETVQLDHVVGGPWVTVAMVATRDGLRSALVIETTTELRDVEVNAISSLSRECSIALRAVEQTELQVRQRSEERFGALIENSSDIVAVLGGDQRTTYVSPVAARLLGHELEHLLEIDARTLIHPADLDASLGLIRNIRQGVVETVELRLRHRDGSHQWFEVAGVDLSDDPNIGGLLLNLREISDRKAAEEQLVLSEARFKALVQNSTDLVVVLDPSGHIRYASPSVEQVVGVPVKRLAGSHIDHAFRDSDVDWEVQLQRDRASRRPELVEFTFRRGDDDHRTIETSITDLRSEPAVGGFVLNARDVTERKAMEKRLRHQATHDDLTGLINRSHVVEDLDSILGRNRGNTTVAVVALGLDDFKDVNDSLGHAFGDRLLVAVAERLKSLLSFGDIAARVGGDQFVVVVERSHGESHVAELAERLLSAVAMPYNIAGRELTITASAGVMFDHDRSSSGEILLRNADTAMYRAKTDAKRQVVVFEPHMHAASYDRLELRADLARAIESNQFLAHYQPIMDISAERIVGVEALIRWNHPRRGMVGPNLFVPLAEDTGMIGALGEWILKRACTDLAGWRRAFGSALDDLRISVNLSAHQLRDDFIVGTVEQTLNQAGLPADRLVLEVTESTLITETEQTQHTMSQLRELGAQLAVDDFGTGYSSLGYIQQFDFDVLKIDKSFVDGLDTDTNQRIVTAVLDLAAQLKVRTVAEGIETAEQARVLKRLGCELGQGYHYSRPVNEAAFRDLLHADREGTTVSSEATPAKLR